MSRIPRAAPKTQRPALVRARAIASVLLFLLPSVAACRSTDDDVASTQGSSVGEADCGAYAHAMVTSFTTCSLAMDVPVDALRDRFFQSCLLEARAPGSGITSEWLVGCAEQHARSCHPYDPCTLPVVGALPDGAGCGRSSQCASGYCRFAAEGLSAADPFLCYAAGCGTCGQHSVDRQRPAPCGGADCPSGQYCATGGDPDGPSSCLRYALLDEVCARTTETVRDSTERTCRPGLQCVVKDRTASATTSTCRPGPPPRYPGPPTDPQTCSDTSLHGSAWQLGDPPCGQ